MNELTTPRLAVGLTDAHRRAIEWLPSDGSWRSRPGNMASALYSLALYHHALVQQEMKVGPPRWRGKEERQWRLTPDGRVLKRALENEVS